MHGAFPLGLTMAILLAGCTAAPAADEPAQPPDPGEPAAAMGKTFQGSFDLLVNPDPEVIGFGGASRNCVFFWDTDGAAYELLGGNATLTWPMATNTPAMRVRITGLEEPQASASGGSPLAWTFDPGTPRNWGAGFWADYTLTDRSLPAAQEARLELEFTYEGSLPEPSVGTCAGGGP